MSYKKAIEVFESTPEEKKILGHGSYCDDEGFQCAVGFLLGITKRTNLLSGEQSSRMYSELDMTENEACNLVEKNDGFLVPARDRFDYILSYMKTKT